MTRAETLQAQLGTLRASLHALIVARQFALSTGQKVAADGIAIQIQATTATYNNVVAELRQLEGPGTTLVMLDTVGDVVITGVTTGAKAALTAAGDVVKAAGDTAKGLGNLGKLLPVVALLVLVVVGVGFWRGSLGAHVGTP